MKRMKRAAAAVLAAVVLLGLTACGQTANSLRLYCPAALTVFLCCTP